MPTRTITTTTNAELRLSNAIEEIFPVPRDEGGARLHTKTQWALMVIKRQLHNWVKRVEDKQSHDAITPATVADGEIEIS